MKSSRALSLTLAGAVAVTLGIKAFTRQPPEPDTVLFAAEVGQGLRAAGFETSVMRLPSGIYTYGARGPCRVMVTEQDAFGSLADRNGQFAREVGPLHYVWRGRRYDAPPRAVLLTRFLVRRELVRVRLSPARHPLAAVAVGAGCAATAADSAAPVELPR